MPQHGDQQLDQATTQLDEKRARPACRVAYITAFVGLVVAVGVALAIEDGVKRFAFAYLVSFAFVLSVALGSLFFVLMAHLFRAGWSVVVRRPAEVFAANFPVIAILFLPILGFTLLGDGELFPWAVTLPSEEARAAAPEDSHVVLVADGEHADHSEDASDHGLAKLIEGKRPYLNKTFFTLRWIAYLLIWSLLGMFYQKRSTRQDVTGDDSLTNKMEAAAPVATLLFAVTLTFAAFDLLMSLDPAWFSTIFGVYFFCGSVLGGFSLLILTIVVLQNMGYLKVVSAEHYHDLGKMLFAFVFFWGYIAFCQYMLIWYANMPEETGWLEEHGMTTVVSKISGWTYVCVAILLLHLFIPFAGLLSRHAKRNRNVLAFWAAYMLVMHWVDIWWIVMPRLSPTVRGSIGFIEVGCLVAVGGFFMASAIRLLARHSLVPLKDPRLSESLAYQNQ